MKCFLNRESTVQTGLIAMALGAATLTASASLIYLQGPGLLLGAHRGPCGEGLVHRERQHVILAAVREWIRCRTESTHPGTHALEQRRDGNLVVC